MEKPSVSFVFPIYNEAQTLESSLDRLTACLDRLGRDYEFILVENGSRDETASLAESLCSRDPRRRCLHLEASDRSEAIRLGLRNARAELIVAADIDHYDLSFFGRALDELDRTPGCIIVGSKHADGAEDGRPSYRLWSSLLFNSTLRVLFDWSFRDVHGPKAFRRDRLDPADLGDSLPVDVALLALAQCRGLAGIELPIVVAELRPPRKPGPRQALYIADVLIRSLLYRLQGAFSARASRTQE